MNYKRKNVSRIDNEILQTKKFPNKFLRWEETIGRTYILHLDNDLNRKQRLKEELDKIRTTNDKKFSDLVTWWSGYKNRTKYDNKIFNPYYTLHYHWLVDPTPDYHKSYPEIQNEIIKCSEPESLIALSHISILQDILKSDYEIFCILEDDIFFRYDFIEKINTIFEKEIPKYFDILYLSSLPTNFGFSYQDFSSNLLKVNNGVLWVSGIIITKKAVQKLLDNLPVVGPIDIWLNHQFDYLNVFMTKHNLILQDTDIESNNIYSFYEKYGYSTKNGDISNKTLF